MLIARDVARRWSGTATGLGTLALAAMLVLPPGTGSQAASCRSWTRSGSGQWVCRTPSPPPAPAPDPAPDPPAELRHGSGLDGGG